MNETWATPAGFSKYEVSNDGFGPDQRPVRSIDRQVGARRLKGVLLAVKTGTNGRPQVKLYDDTGRQRTVEVHILVMLAHTGRPCPPGMTVRHYDDDPWNNRWRPGDEAASVAAGGNLFYGTDAQQQADKYRNGRPQRRCVVCRAASKTKRCGECTARLGALAAGMLRAGHPAADVAAHLGYPTAEAVLALAVTHGGYGDSWIKRAMATVRHLTSGRSGRRRSQRVASE